MAEGNGIEIINGNLQNSEFSKVYLLGGNEKYLVEQYKKKLIQGMIDTQDTMNYIVYKGENAKPESIAEFALTMPFLADKRVILVEDSDFFKKGNESIEELLEQIPDTTIIVFVENNIDKRCKLYKLVSKLGTVCNFDTPDEKTLLVWVKSLFSKENIKIDDAAVYRLVEGVGMDMNNLYNEVEKLKCYCIESGHVTADIVDHLCISQVEGKIFEMMDALSQRNKKKTMDLYDDLLLLREPMMRILFLINRQFNILIKVKLGLSNGTETSRLASLLKIPPFAIKKYVAQCKGYTYEQLLRCVNLCQDADTNIKTGVQRDTVAVEMLILNLLQ